MYMDIHDMYTLYVYIYIYICVKYLVLCIYIYIILVVRSIGIDYIKNGRTATNSTCGSYGGGRGAGAPGCRDRFPARVA